MEPSFYREHHEGEDRDWWHVGRRRVLADVLAVALRDGALPPASLRVLDVGCGTGGTTAFLARSLGFTSLVACDFAAEALAFTAGRGLKRLVRASAERLPFRDGSFDLVLALDVLEHHDDDVAVARELRRVLRPGGLALATVPAWAALWGPHDVIAHHRRRYRREQLEQVLAAGGLEVRRSSHFNALVFPGVWALQTARRLARRGRPALPASDNPRHMPRAMNALLRELLAGEGPWVSRRSLPFGVSLLALAAAPGGAP